MISPPAMRVGWAVVGTLLGIGLGLGVGPTLVQMAIVLTRGAPFAEAGTEAVPGRMRHAVQRLGG